MAEHIAGDLDATVASFDWIMSGLRAAPEVWAHVELPVERQRRVGWNVLSRVAEQQLRRGASCVLDLVARDEPIREWRQLAADYGATFAIVECICSDVDVHRSRVDGRERRIPGWYELEWDHVQKGRQLYEPLPEPKVVIDAIAGIDQNRERVRRHLSDRDRSRGLRLGIGQPGDVDDSNEPVDLEVNREEGVTIRFADGHVARIGLLELRQGCPCATCRSLRERGEEGWPRPGAPDPLRITDAQFHGAYALQITWNDGHRTGLYPFEALRRWSVSGPPR